MKTPNLVFVVRRKELDMPVSTWRIVDTFSTRSAAKRLTRSLNAIPEAYGLVEYRLFTERW